MRKFTLLIASLFFAIGAMAQSNSYTRIAEFEAARTNSKVYALKTTRSPLYFNTQHNELAGYWTTQAQALQGEQANAAATAQQFAFLRTDKTAAGQYYMYSVEGQCFITTAGAKSEEPGILVSFADVTDKDDANHQGLKLYLGTTGNNVVNVTYWNSNTAGGVRYNTNSEADAGNVYELIAYDQDVDLSEAIAKIEAFEADNTEAVAELDEAIDQAIAMSAFIGEGVGKYSYTGDGNYQDKFAAITAFRQGITATNTPTPEEVAAKTAELNALLSSFVLNMPEKGKYYRFKDWDTDNYMLSDEYSSTRLAMGTNKVSSIFYYGEDGSLLSYANGCYLPKAVAGGDWTCLAVGTTGPAATFGEGTSVGTYGFYVGDQENRAYYSGRNTYVDAGGTIAANNGYDWILEEVTELPVTVTAAGYATLYAPVALTVPTTGVTAHTVTLNGEWATLSEALTTIPANTGVVLVGEGSHSFAITTADAFDGTNALEGTVAATNVTKDAYVLGVVDEKVGFYTATKNQADNNAFLNNSHKAYLPKTTGMNAVSYSFRFGEGTTGVEKVEIRNEKSEIYDLTGRRVETITEPGIYIVNGKKVLVK